jgi:uncharacterized repeat protein (TIGR01451 family)
VDNVSYEHETVNIVAVCANVPNSFLFNYNTRPIQDADIYIDFQNKGLNFTNYTVKALASIRVSDPIDKDMSGASIFAVKPGTGRNGQPVDIAVAWGQDPLLANAAPDWEKSMDLGTAVLPLSIINVAVLENKQSVNAGEEIEYTIRISNSGQKHVYANNLTLVDTLDSEVTYVSGSAVMITKAGNVTAVQDSSTGTPFPFDGTGYVIPIDIARRGAYIDFVFKVMVNAMLSSAKENVLNNGILKKLYDGSQSAFEVKAKIDYSPAIKVKNLVAQGADGSMCQYGEELVEGKNGTDVVYCFNITNTGDSYLSNIVVMNAELMYSNNSIPILAPGASTMIGVVSKISANLTNQVSVTAKPTLNVGTLIYGENDVTATDGSSVILKAAVNGTVRSGYSTPTNSTNCLQDNWDLAGKVGDLVCASKEIYIETASSASAVCMPGEPITLSVNASIHLAGSRKDIGWYIAHDGGDALVGECIVNGLQNNGADYNVMDTATGQSKVGYVRWTTGSNTDECGDVFITNTTGTAKMEFPILVAATILCSDENDDGYLDFAVCFTWKSASAAHCTLAANIPSTDSGCYCTRVDVPNVEAVTQATDFIEPC